jgi:hypothetical protein
MSDLEKMYKISFGGASYITDEKPNLSNLEGDETIKEVMISRKAYEEMEEFQGF